MNGHRKYRIPARPHSSRKILRFKMLFLFKLYFSGKTRPERMAHKHIASHFFPLQLIAWLKDYGLLQAFPADIEPLGNVRPCQADNFFL